MPLLIGSDYNQNPANADLGELAFQNKSSVNFTDGSGALSELSLNPIYREISTTATRLFVYDTRNDSDGGAWRKRTQNTSWYNEELNTATRGRRREFPSIAVIATTASTLTIYDGDDVNLPMWMVFEKGPDSSNTKWWDGNNSNTPSGIFCLNGMLVLATSNAGAYSANFISEELRNWYNGGTSGVREASIAQRNGSFGRSGTTEANNTALNTAAVKYDVSMAVLPGAQPDRFTGLPSPVIAFGTSAGIIFVEADHSVTNGFRVSRTADPGVYYPIKVKLGSDGSLWAVLANSGTFNYSVGYASNYNNVVDKDISTYSNWSDWGGFNYSTIYSTSSGGQLTFINRPSYPSSDIAVNDIVNADTLNIGAQGTPYGLTLTHVNKQLYKNGMTCYITSKSNTGWMPGDCRGAWLNNCEPGILDGRQRFPNWDFSSATNPITSSSNGGSSSIVSGRLKLSGGSTGGFADHILNLDFPLIQGKTYQFHFQLHSQEGSSPLPIGFYNLQQGEYVPAFGYTNRSPGTYTFDYTAPIDTTGLDIVSGGTASQFNILEFVSIREVDPNQVSSTTNRGLDINGIIVKEQVATGSDVVLYGPFSDSNYFFQPYNASYNDIGTGDICIAFWLLTSDSGDSEIFYLGPSDRSSSNPTNGFNIWTYGTALKAELAGASWTQHASGTARSGFLEQHIIIRRSGGNTEHWIDGTLRFAGYNNGSVGDASYTLYVGKGYYQSGIYSKVALLRLSAKAPSPEQIRKMYNDEKMLFQPNSKATLYGTSDAVAGLAYDRDTQFIHVGTSSGRSVFDGIERVGNTTVSATYISASNGFVAEE